MAAMRALLQRRPKTPTPVQHPVHNIKVSRNDTLGKGASLKDAGKPIMASIAYRGPRVTIDGHTNRFP